MAEAQPALHICLDIVQDRLKDSVLSLKAQELCKTIQYNCLRIGEIDWLRRHPHQEDGSSLSAQVSKLVGLGI